MNHLYRRPKWLTYMNYMRLTQIPGKSVTIVPLTIQSPDSYYPEAVYKSVSQLQRQLSLGDYSMAPFCKDGGLQISHDVEHLNECILSWLGYAISSAMFSM